MSFMKGHFLSVAWLLMLCLSTGSFADSLIRCVDEKTLETLNSEDPCKYYRINDGRTASLWVVPEGEDPENREAAVRGASFYVYVPQEQKLDSIKLKLKSDNSGVKNLTEVKSSETDGLVKLGISSDYGVYNINLGTSDDDVATRPIVSIVYNFYVPRLKYIVKGEEVTDVSKLQYEVGDTMHVDVEAIIPMGPQKGSVDTGLTKTFYFTPFGESENLMFLSEGGQDLKLDDETIRLDINGGRGKFMVVAPKAITDGSTFSMNAYKDPKDTTKFILTEPFPGEYQFVNPDMPMIEKAAIYDRNGDGIGDSIATWFGGKTDSMSVDSFFYSWPDDKSFKEFAGEKTCLGDVCEYPGVKVELQKDSATGAVKARVCSVGGRCEWQQTSLTDSIGAAIQSATLLKGSDGTDTMIVRFNKDMDPSWTSGLGLLLNSNPIDVDAISKKGTQWVFTVESGVVSVGDMLKISTICSSKDCPDGILTAADGVPTSANNQEVPVQNAGRIYVDNDKNGFYDRDGDGRMDSTSLGFETPITEDDLKKMDITFYWLDNDGELVAIKPNLADLTISENGTLLGFALNPEEYDIKNMLTGIDKSYSKGGKIEYGYAVVKNTISVEGKSIEDPDSLYGMNDYMAPVISSTFLNPESFQMMEPDKFKITFSEAMDKKNVNLTDDCLAFYVDGEWVHYSLTSSEWSDDGRELILYMEAGLDLATRMNPADSVRFDNFTSGLVDKKGNKVSELSPAVMVEGDPRVIMKNNSFADLNKAEELSDRVKPFTIEHVKDAKEASDQSSLGVLMDIGYSTIMEKDSVGMSVPNMEDIGLHWELYVYTNIGNYVGGASGSIACDDPFFDGNCLENPDKLYVRWNMRADNGRKVGAGIYLAKFRVKVYGAKSDFKVERIFRWGISAKRSK
ncbi:hypothetical protein SAMN05720473_11147 [Fibrobacter sp. UWB15]|uniref:hypothetical protein n=1 Tax=unclassified Fibrobacter TaxID=2634177 RepID=UPI0009191B96|nr:MULTISPECIES: hypothetical protein [unclassified Fibrobacter]PWJ62368.1 hypothetical protein BGW99_11246 [Fibrobacter sp. UWB6]SHG51398.1 hypothetical protein SAMN05720760_11327 [Fibrobacter sp. UWB8]SMG40636.1 hypothetical protein SAMN05720473_11147 [Fibrobacter sp. UWB15]